MGLLDYDDIYATREERQLRNEFGIEVPDEETTREEDERAHARLMEDCYGD